MPKTKALRKVLRVNTDELLRHLKVVHSHGLHEQGPEKAVQIGRNILYWKKGAEITPLTLAEVGQKLSHLQ